MDMVQKREGDGSGPRLVSEGASIVASRAIGRVHVHTVVVTNCPGNAHGGQAQTAADGLGDLAERDAPVIDRVPVSAGRPLLQR